MSDKPPVTWHPAASANYTAAARSPGDITYIIIHITQGSWSGTLNWFQNPAANVSAHYTVRSNDGKIAQSVSDQNIAWHAGNWNYNATSIGIEHEGYVDDPAWFTETMYRSSAKLAAYYITQWGVSFDRDHIIGHNQVPGADHTDPGRWWWWSYYFDRIREYV